MGGHVWEPHRRDVAGGGPEGAQGGDPSCPGLEVLESDLGSILPRAQAQP